MAVNDVSSIRIVGRYQDQNIVNLMHYKHTAQSSPEADVLESLCTAWDNAMQLLWLGRHSANYKLVGYKAFRKVGAGKTPGFLSIGLLGSLIGDDVSSTLCRTITLYTGSSNFRRHGRVMLSGSQQNQFNDSDGAVTNAELTLLEVLATALKGQITNAGDEFDPVIPAVGALPMEPITDAKARPTPASITSRRVRQYLIG